MNKKVVTLSTGQEVTVYLPPLTRIYDIAGKKCPEPKPPIRTDKAATGREISMIIEDDPEYLEAHDKWEVEYNETVDEALWVFALRDEWPPEDFEWGDRLEMIQYFDPAWKPREDKIGAKLDWVQWVLLENMNDATLIQQTIQELLGIKEDVVDQTEASFPSEVAGETD